MTVWFSPSNVSPAILWCQKLKKKQKNKLNNILHTGELTFITLYLLVGTGTLNQTHML